MRDLSLNANSVRARARCIGLPRPIVDQVVADFLKWSSNSGVEWAVSHMKDIKAAIICAYAGGELPKDLWVKKSSPHRLAGVYGWLQDHLETRKGRRKVLQLLNIYTSVVAQQLTPKQEKKFISSVEGKRADVPVEYHDRLRRSARKVGMVTLPPVRDFITSAGRRKEHEARMLPEFLSFFSKREGRELLTSDPEVTKILMKGLNPILGTQSPRWNDGQPATIGEIHITQEHGHKARFFASPHLWLQHCLEPMKIGLLALLKRLPWDGTHNQRVADEPILAALQMGKTVHCFDLSDATNVFPLELQITVLKQVIGKSSQGFVTLFEQISNLPWRYGPRLIRWERGQALGLGPSFPMFALTHGLLLYSLAGDTHDGKFFIIGDDVVIIDDTLAREYEEALRHLDLPFSPTKTLRSNRIAEFAGFTYTSDGQMFQAAKWKQVRDDNLLDLVRVFGPGLIPTLPRSNRDFVSWFCTLPEPVGLGYNPRGIPLDDRLVGLVDYLIEEKIDTRPRDYSPRKRVESRLRSLPPRSQSWLGYVLFGRQSGGVPEIQAAEQAARAQASQAFKDYKAQALVRYLDNLGVNVSLAETIGGVKIDLPVEQPRKFRMKRPLPRLKTLRKKLAPAYELQTGALQRAELHGN